MSSNDAGTLSKVETEISPDYALLRVMAIDGKVKYAKSVDSRFTMEITPEGTHFWFGPYLVTDFHEITMHVDLLDEILCKQGPLICTK